MTIFLSTPSARRATSTTSTSGAFTIFLSTPSARRATSSDNLDIVDVGISIHALREEGDGSLMVTMPFLMRFLSTPSARRATMTSSR